MSKHFQKSENLGGRIDSSSKILGSIKLEANTIPTIISGINTWVRIGTGAVAHIPFESTLPDHSPYFRLVEDSTVTQYLLFKKGKTPTFLNIHFGMAARITDGGIPSNVELRVRRTDTNNITSTISQTFGSISTVGLNFPFQLTQPIALVSGDQIFMEIRNTTAIQDIIVTAANLSFSQ